MRVTETLVRAIVRAEKPRHVKVFESVRRRRWPRKGFYGGSGLSGLDADGNPFIRVPPLDDLHSLFLFFHEVGHVRLGHLRIFGNGSDIGHANEYDAEQFAVATMKKYGLLISRNEIELARWRIRWWIRFDERRKRPIKSHIRRWAKSR